MRTTRSPWKPRLSKRVARVTLLAKARGSISIVFWTRDANDKYLARPPRLNVSPDTIRRITAAVENEHWNGVGEVYAQSFNGMFGWQWRRSDCLVCDNCVYRAFQIAADEISGPRTVEEIIFGGDDCNGAQCELKPKGAHATKHLSV